MQDRTKGLVFLGIVVFLAAISGYIFKSQDFVYGIDIKGGIRLTYELKFDPAKEAEQRKDVAGITSRLITILETRISGALGVAEGSVMRKGEDQIVVELPGTKDIDRARDLLSSTAKIVAYHAPNVNSPRADFRRYSIGDLTRDEKTGSYFQSFVDTRFSKTIKPGDPEYAEMIAGWTKILEGEELASAAWEIQGGNRTIPTFKFSAAGAAKMEKWSRTYTGQQENLAFVLDDRVLSIAPLNAGAIISTDAIIEGTFEPAYVQSLAKLLNAGALPVELSETSSSLVDPTIGDLAFNQMVNAGLIAFGITVLFLIVYYSFPGFVALLALLLYVLFTLSVMKLINQTLSLAGLAGFILSIGMAVDANILVFERMKEEMREGRSLMTSVELGFKRAFPAILDSNACTIITSLVLVTFGTGAVRGFASTLIIGVMISLFTAITCTRSLLVFLVSSGIGNNQKSYAMDRSWFGEKFEREAMTNPLKVMSKSKRWFTISVLTILPGLIFLGMGGIKPNVEFRGGIEAEYILPATNTLTANQVTENLEKNGYKSPVVKVSSGADGARVIGITVDSSDLSKEAVAKIGASAGITEAPKGASTVGPTIQKAAIENAVKGIVVSSVLIVLYLALRFGFALGGIKNGLKFGLSAILAMAHDILVVVGIAAIVGYAMNWQVSALFVTAMLTVIGFSVHDTIVIFDRIRENLRHPQAGETFEHLCDRSISQSFGRSINTSMIVIVTLILLIAIGTPTIDLKFFCVTMLVGILSGTYSSIYNASPILWLWDRMTARTRGEEHTLVAEAIRESARIRNAQAHAMSAAGIGGSTEAGYGTVKRKTKAKDHAREDLD